MDEVWTHLEVEMNPDATISVGKYSWYDYDSDGNGLIARETVAVESTFDLYAAVMNSMLTCFDMFDDPGCYDYGEYWFVAADGGEFCGYCIRQDDVEDINADGEVILYPLGIEWANDIDKAVDRCLGEE